MRSKRRFDIDLGDSISKNLLVKKGQEKSLRQEPT